LLLARRVVAWGPTAEALSPERLRESAGMPEAFDDHAPFCASHAA
jgi:zinc/manganese transport system ATP-binding protein